MDGAGLTEALHARGINVRYLGRVAAALRPHAPLAYLHAIALAELLLRAAKHIYTGYLQVRCGVFKNDSNKLHNMVFVNGMTAKELNIV